MADKPRQSDEYQFYSNYPCDDYYEELEQRCRTDLFDRRDDDLDEPDWDHESQVPDQKVFDEVAFYLQSCFKDLRREFNRWIEWLPGPVVVQGACGRWDGTFPGGQVCSSLQEVLGGVESCDYWKLYETKKGELMLWGAHHDGVNLYEIRPLNLRGIEWRWANSYADRQTMCETLGRPAYSRRAHYRKWLRSADNHS